MMSLNRRLDIIEKEMAEMDIDDKSEIAQEL